MRAPQLGLPVARVLGGLLIFLGLAVLPGSPSPFLVASVMSALVTARFVEPEGHDRERRFGERSLRCRQRVRRRP